MNNRQNLAKLNYGMTDSEVTAIMGTETFKSRNNPYRTAMFRNNDGKQINVWYYWTDQRGYRDDEKLTPVVFSDGKVIGWGREFWSEFVTKYEIRIKSEKDPDRYKLPH
jgi:hypothetical protein